MRDSICVDFKRSMSRTLTELQEFYFTTEHRDRLAGMGRVKRWLYLSFWLLKSGFAERVFVLVPAFFHFRASG
jgi:hypothetical protein